MALSTVRLRTLTHPAAYLVLPDDDGGCWFGLDVSIDGTNDLLIASDPNKYHDFGAGAVKSGAVYVFDWTTGDSIQEILPENVADQVAGAYFGWCVATDGDWLVITCGGAGAVVGTIYFYEWTGPVTKYVYRQRLSGNGAGANDAFGCSVGISGSLCVVGDDRADNNGSNSGTIHVFRESAGTWAEDVAAKQHAVTTQDSQYFGHAIAVDGDYIGVTANQFFGAHDDQGRAYVFEDGGAGNSLVLRETLLPTNDNGTEDYFGDSIDLKGDYCAVGWPNYNEPGDPIRGGSIQIYKRDGISWPHHQSLSSPTASDAASGELGFGSWTGGGVALAGLYLLGGARGWGGNPDPGGWPGAAFIWKRDETTNLYAPVNAPNGWDPVANPYAIYPAGWIEFGATVAITENGKIAISGYSEYGDWATNDALPEGPPPAYTYGGTVRQYLLNDPPYLIDGPSGIQNDYVLRGN